MRTYAVIENNVVAEVSDLDDLTCRERLRLEMLIDVTDQVPQPQVGWLLEGNKLVNLDQLDAIQQTSQRLFGIKLLALAVDMVGARNLKLAREGTPADVNSLATQMQTVKLLLEGGALKTTRTICNLLKPGYPLHADILQYVITEINNFLNENKWN